MAETTFRAVLFDLDGTLVDTLPDIAASMNAALIALGLRTLPDARIGAFVGKGPRALALRVLDEQPAIGTTDRVERADALLSAYVANYRSRAGESSALFSGAKQAVEQLYSRGFKLGVITNSLQDIAEAILTRFDLARFMTLIIGGDRVEQGKPHPEALLLACHRFGLKPACVLLVGDSENDVLAARAAGCAIVAVPHGYRAGEPVESLGCDVVAGFSSLCEWIDARVPR